MAQTNISIEQPRRNGSPPHPRALPEWILSLIRPIVGVLSRLLWGIRWRHPEYIPLSGGIIIASNHQTYMDPFWLSVPVKRPTRYLAWDAAFSWPLVGTFLRWFGAWPLQLEGSGPTPIKRSLQWIKEGGAVVIFPEGGRGNPDGSMRKLKAGAVRMALEAGVPILPVTIRGGHNIWPSTFRFPRFKRDLEIIYHPLFVMEPCENEETREYARRESLRLAEIIKSAL